MVVRIERAQNRAGDVAREGLERELRGWRTTEEVGRRAEQTCLESARVAEGQSKEKRAGRGPEQTCCETDVWKSARVRSDRAGESARGVGFCV